jgi:hypothetical protein
MQRLVGRLVVSASVLFFACDSKNDVRDGGGADGGITDAPMAPGDAGAADTGTIDAARDSAGPADAADAAADTAADAPAADTALVLTALDPIRTFAYHELTRLPATPTYWPVISADGSAVAFTTAAANATRIGVNLMKSDGTGLQEIDSYQPKCFCAGKVDISADGKSVVSNDAVQIRFAQAGAAARPVLVLNSNEIWDVRLSGDGARVFFLLRRNADVVATGVTLERGVYVVNNDGTGLRQVTGATTIAAALATTPDKVFPLAGCGRSLDVSRDGTRIAFAAATAGMESVYAVNTDGTGLRKLVEASGGFKLVNKIGLSGDGRLVAFHVYVDNGMIELGVIGFDGTGRRKLGVEPPDQLAGCSGSLRLTDDASKLYVSEPSFLYDTDGSGVMQLSTAAFRPPGGAPVQDGTPNGWMNAAGSRFVYHVVDDANIAQLMLLEINPASLGAAPMLSAPTFTPKMGTAQLISTALSTVAAAGAGLSRVAVVFYANGRPDVIDRGPGQIFNDKGLAGDAVAGDGIFSGRGFDAFNPPKPGPRTVRFTAESKSDGRRHATVLEAGTVTVQ